MMTPSPTTVRATVSTGGKIRVLIVDDSAVVRHVLREALQSDPSIEVVGAESNGVTALARIPIVKPDLVTLDVEMPQMDGLETLRRIRKDFPRLRTVMFSSLTNKGAAVTLEALSLGADDYVAKAVGTARLDDSLAVLRSELLPKIRQFFQMPRSSRAAPPSMPAHPTTPVRARAVKGAITTKPRVLAIGVSTGGPNALAQLVPSLPAGFPIPVLIVQHMPATFTKLLAERLDASSPLEVREADHGMEIIPGRVVLARGNYHLQVHGAAGHVTAVLDQGPQENSCRPAVDVLFRTAATVYGAGVLSVVLTGMGCDGLRGTQAVKAARGYSIVQDEATSVVWGMPGSVAEAGLADQILSLEEIGREIVRLAAR